MILSGALNGQGVQVCSGLLWVNNLTGCLTANLIYLHFDTQVFGQRGCNHMGLWTITNLRYYGMIPAKKKKLCFIYLVVGLHLNHSRSIYEGTKRKPEG